MYQYYITDTLFLTPGEAKLMQKKLLGLEALQIQCVLKWHPTTYQFHLKNLMRKFNCDVDGLKNTIYQYPVLRNLLSDGI